MTAPQHAASRPWLTEALDWLLGLIASLASRITPMIARRVPRAAGGATGSPVAGAPEAPVPPSPPAGRGASSRDTWVIHHPEPGSPLGWTPVLAVRRDGLITLNAHGHVGIEPRRELTALRTPTAPNPVLSGPETTPLRMLPDPPVVRGWYLAWLAEHPEAEVTAA